MRIILCVLTFISVNCFSQGKIDGFYRGEGNITTVLGAGYENFDGYYAGRNKVDLSRKLHYITFFASYGVSENLDLQVNLPYLISGNNKDFQDLGLFLKYRFYHSELEKGHLQLSFGTGFSTPLSNYAIGDLNDLGQQATILEGRAMIHYQTHRNWFTTLQSGFSYKFDEVPNSIPFALKIGHAGSKWYYDAYYEYQHSFDGTDYLGAPRPQNFKEFGVDYHKIGATLYKPISNDFGAYVSYSYLLLGRNVFHGPAYGLGFSFNIKTKD